MTRKLITTIIVILVLILAMSAYSYAVWLEQLEGEIRLGQDSNSWNPSEKYLVFELAYESYDQYGAPIGDPIGYVVTGYIGIINHVEIPERHKNTDLYEDELNVIGIKSSFSNILAMTQLTMPSTLKYIEENAVLNCSNLTKVIFKAQYVEEVIVNKLEIRNYAFLGCTALTTFIVQDMNKIELATFAARAERFTSISATAFYDTPIKNTVHSGGLSFIQLLINAISA